MACCVVLNHRPQDVCGDDSLGNSASAASTSSTAHPSNRPNPEPPVSCGASAAVSCPPSRGRKGKGGLDTLDDHGTRTNMAADFKEPWSKLLSFAKEKSRQTRSKAKEASMATTAPNDELEKTKLKKAISSAKPKPNIGGTKPTELEKKSIPSAFGTSLSTSKACTDKVASVNTPMRQERTPRVTSLGKRKSRQRASSVEWDYSGSESADTPSVPQNKKRKASRRRKRDASVEMDWAPNELDSETTNNDFDAFHQCSICNLKFKRPWRLRVHLQQHLQPDDRPFKCDEDGCSKGYFYKVHLDRHKSRSHSDLVIKFKTMCPSEGCHRIFESQGGLKRHINKIHSVENLKFHCPHCDKKFSKNRQLRFHIAEHNGEPPIRCKECNAGVFSDRALKHHMRTHKKYPCDVSGCDKVFSTYPTFQKHKAEHNKCFQSLQCAHCNKEFKKKSELRDHIMTHLDQRTIYKCTYDSCPRFYYQERNLRSHLRVYHEKTSSFACTWEGCEMQFLSRKALSKHLNVHENGRAEMKPKEGPKAPRKDKGKPKRAMATQLAGMPVHRGVEKALLAPDRIVEICGSKGEEKPVSCSRAANRRLSKSKRSKSTKNASTSGTDQSNNYSSTDSVNIVSENNIILQDENCAHPLSVEENDNIISRLTGKVFEIREGGILVEVEETSPTINAVVNSDQTEENTQPIQSGSQLENSLNNTFIPEIEQTLEIVDGAIVIGLGQTLGIPENVTISDLAEEDIHSEHTPISSLSKDCSDNTPLLKGDKTSKTGNACASSLVYDSNVTVTDENSHLALIGSCAGMSHNSTTVLEKENDETNLHSPEIVQIDESDTVAKSNFVPDCEEEENACGTIFEANPQTDSQNNNQAEESERQCDLSATLCAETIVDGPQGESELFLLIPLLKLSAGEASSAAVARALSGDMEVYSVAGKNANAVLAQNPHESNESSPVKKVSLNDPSVTSVLQPLIQDLAKKSGLCSNSVKNTGTSKIAKQLIRNPAHTHTVIRKLAKFISNAEKVPLKDPKIKKGRSFKDNLQGPAEELTQSDSSSVSESDDSRSDSGSDDHNSSNEDDAEADDNLSGNGDGGNEDDDGDDENEDDEQPTDEDTDDEEDNNDDDENGNDGAGYLNGDDNNNNDNNESNSEGSEEQADPNPTNGHQGINDGSDLGIDRASSPKQNTLDEYDDVRSTHSDDLIIDVEADEDEKVPADQLSPKEAEQKIATLTSPPQFVPSPEKEDFKIERRSSRLKKVDVSMDSLEDQNLIQAIDFMNPKLKCVHCKKEFKERRDLGEHIMNAHSGRKIYKCTYDSCLRFYYQKRNLQNHIRVNHEKTPSGGQKLYADAAQPNGNLSVGKSNEIHSFAKKAAREKQEKQSARRASERVKSKAMSSVQKEKKKGPNKRITYESDSSGSDVVQPHKKRRCNIGDDSDSSVGQTIDKDPNTSVKEETDAHLESPQDIKSPLHISLRVTDMSHLSLLKSPPLSPSQDPLRVPGKNEALSPVEPKMEPRTSLACSQLSEEAWIRVLRQVSKVMKLSLTAAEN